MDVSQASLIPLSKALFSLTVTGSSLAAGVSDNLRARKSGDQKAQFCPTLQLSSICVAI